MKQPRVTRLPAALPAPLAARLRTFAWLVRLRDAGADLGWLLLVTAGVITLACALDRLVDLPGTWRVHWPILAALAALVLALRGLWHLLRRSDYDALARTLDHASGDARGHLRSLLDFHRRELPATGFAGMSGEAAVARWQDRAVAPLLQRRPLRPLAAALLVLLALGALTQWEPVRAALLLRRFADPLGNHMRPTATWFEVTPPPASPIPGGDDYTIRARLRGRPVAQPIPLVQVTTAGGSPTIHRLVQAADGSWELVLREVPADRDFVLTMGTARSARYHLAVLPRPVIERLQVTYQFPEYTRLPPRQETLAGRVITALEGTKVRVDVTTNVPLQALSGVVEQEPRPFTLDRKDPRHGWRYHTLAANERMELVLHATNGLDNPHELPLSFRVVPDAPPVVTITNDPAARPLFANEALVVGYKAQDDLGLAEVALVSAAGDFTQDANLEQYGAKEASGVITVPVASLLRPGTDAVQVRLTALDSKGQRSASPPVTITIAANSYDRQLRAARRAFTSNERSGNPASGERLGFPARERQAQRLAALKGANGKLTVLRELLADNTAPGPGEQKPLDELRQALAGVQPGFLFVVPGVTYGHGALRAIDVLGRAPMTPRLARTVRDAAVGAELAQVPETLAAGLKAALAAPHPKAALGTWQDTVLKDAIARQELVVAQLNDSLRMVNLELAGYLAANLDLALHQPAAATLSRDAQVAHMARLQELGALLAEPLAELVPEAQRTAFATALKNTGEQATLAAAAPLLPPLVTTLQGAAEQAALAPSAEGLDTLALLRAAAPQPSADWRDLYALWVDIQLDDEDADEEVLWQHALCDLRLMGSGTLTPPADERVAGTPLRLAVTLQRLAAQASGLRVALVAGQCSPGDPTCEPQWLRLRELAFALRREQAHLAGPAAADAPALAAFTATLAPLAGWLPASTPTADLPTQLASWASTARTLAAHQQNEARQRLRLLAGQVATLPELLPAAVDRYRAEIAGQIAILERSHVGEDAHAHLPAMCERLAVLDAAVLKALDVTEAAALPGPTATEPKVPLARLVALRVGLQGVREQLEKQVGAPINNVGSKSLGTKQYESVAWKGKQQTWRDQEQLIAAVRDFASPTTPMETITAWLRTQVLLPRSEQEQRTIAAALALAAAAPATPAAVLSAAGSDKTAAPAYWGDLVVATAELRRALGSREPAAGATALATLTPRLTGAPALPRDAQLLASLKERGATALPTAAGARTALQQDLDGALEALRPLATPPPVYPDEARRQQQQLAVWRARLALADGADAAAAHDALAWAVLDLEWSRRKHEAAVRQVGIGGLDAAVSDEFANLKLPKHLYLELKRAREGALPDLFKERSHKYLSTLMEKAR